jgi:outer membrane lipoprotein-sorting protein
MPVLHPRAWPRRWRATAFCLLVSAVAWPAGGQGKANQPNDPSAFARDPAAIALREKMVKAYRGLRAYRARVTQRQWQHSPQDAVVIEIEVRYRKPNRLYLDVDYPQIAQTGRWHLIWACDGKTLTFYNSARAEYQRLKAPARLDRLALASALRGPEFDLLLRDDDPFAALDKAGIVRYTAGFEQSDQDTSDILQLDIQQGEAQRTLRYRLDPKDNLLRGFRLQILPDPGTKSPFLDEEVAATVEAEYIQVEVNPRLTDADFRFTPPAEAKEKTAPAAH